MKQTRPRVQDIARTADGRRQTVDGRGQGIQCKKIAQIAAVCAILSFYVVNVRKITVARIYVRCTCTYDDKTRRLIVMILV